MKLIYIGKEDEANGLKPGDIKDCGIETATFARREDAEFISVFWHEENSKDTMFTFKPYKTFRKLFEEWKEVGEL